MPSKEALIDHSNDTQYAAIYARVSSKDQDKDFFIQTPLQAGLKLAKRERCAAPLTDIFIDNGSVAQCWTGQACRASASWCAPPHPGGHRV